MKKLLALALILIMCMGSLAACGKEQTTDPTPTTAPTTAPTQAPVEETVSDLVNAKNYLFTMYKDQTEATPVDYTVVGVVNIGGVLFPIEWTVDNDTVKIVPGDDKMVTIDVDDKNPEEVTYVLTATLKDDKGNTETCSFTHRVPAAIVLDEGMSYAEIVDAAYTLEDGLTMEGTFRLYGTVTKIDSAWSDQYKNITVTIAVAGREDKTVQCYRLAGEGAENLKVGDAITVEGTFKNYKGTIEFDQGCVLIGYGEHKDYTALLDAAYTLEDGLAMQEPCTMSGVINKIDSAWSDQYKNITVIMTVNGVEDKPIMCYRLAGEGAEGLAVGDYITVTGTIKNYKGTIEFDQGCTLDNVVKAAGSEEPVEPATDLVINFADLTAGGYGYNAALNGDAVDVTIASQYQEIQYILPEAVELSAYTTLVVDVTSNAQLDIKLVNSDAVLNEYSQKTPFLDNYTAEGQAITEPVIIDLTTYADKDLSQINFMAMGNDVAFTIKSITFTTEPVEVGPVITAADLFDAAKVIEAATNMADDATFAAVLKGTVAEINTEYSEQYGNITITINVAGTDKTFYCYRLKGDGAATLAVGDEVAIVGTISKYNGKPQFGAGCLLVPVDAFESVQAAVAGYALVAGESIENKTITGVVTEVNTAYSEQYGNVTVTIVAAGQDAYKIECFRMKGDVAPTVAVGDTITVTGKLLNYNGKIEFDAGCIGTAVAGTEAPAESTETPVAAEKIELNANDVTAGAIEAATTFGGFTIVGSADAAVTVDSNSKKSDSGLEFTQRIKLGGSGSLDNRHISFTTAGAAKITVYAMSSSSSEDRPLLLVNTEGAEIGRGTAPGTVTDSTIPVLTFEVTETGTYFLYSEKSGINVYYVSVE